MLGIHNEENYNKSNQVLDDLNRSTDLPLTLKLYYLNAVKWWVDASFVLHPDMRSHPEGCINISRGGSYTHQGNTISTQKV